MSIKMTKEKWILLAGISVFLFVVVYIIVNRRKVMSYVRQKVWDFQTEAQIRSLHPAARERVREFINRADRELGMKLRIPKDGGNRTFERQTELWNQGRGTAGAIVTNSKAGESYHNYALAFDVVEMRDGEAWGYRRDYPQERWQRIATLGKSMGFEWGGDWPSPRTDKPHFQLTFGKSWQELLAMKKAGRETGGYVIV